MASRTASREPYEEPFWRTPAAKIMLVVFVVTVGFLGIRKLERINQRYQVENRLSRDPQMGPTLAKWRSIIADNLKAKPGPRDQLPIALYFGVVAEFVESQPKFGLNPTRVLKLQSPQLLAGQGAKFDSKDKVEVAYKNYPTGQNKPKPGEEWMVSVWRDSEGNNVIHSAYRCPAPPQ
jgi:hypothetical protein